MFQSRPRRRVRLGELRVAVELVHEAHGGPVHTKAAFQHPQPSRALCARRDERQLRQPLCACDTHVLHACVVPVPEVADGKWLFKGVARTCGAPATRGRILGLGAAVRGAERKAAQASCWRVCSGSGSAPRVAHGLRARVEVDRAGSGCCGLRFLLRSAFCSVTMN